MTQCEVCKSINSFKNNYCYECGITKEINEYIIIKSKSLNLNIIPFENRKLYSNEKNKISTELFNKVISSKFANFLNDITLDNPELISRGWVYKCWRPSFSRGTDNKNFVYRHKYKINETKTMPGYWLHDLLPNNFMKFHLHLYPPNIAFLDFLLKNIKDPSKFKIFDYACGNGLFLMHLYLLGFDIKGSDKSDIEPLINLNKICQLYPRKNQIFGKDLFIKNTFLKERLQKWRPDILCCSGFTFDLFFNPKINMKQHKGFKDIFPSLEFILLDDTLHFYNYHRGSKLTSAAGANPHLKNYLLFLDGFKQIAHYPGLIRIFKKCDGYMHKDDKSNYYSYKT